jgi:hypothetical protein
MELHQGRTQLYLLRKETKKLLNIKLIWFHIPQIQDKDWITYKLLDQETKA